MTDPPQPPEHSHPHPHQHRYASSRRRLVFAFVSQAVFFVAELVGGLLTNSLALLADAGHMFSDVAALGLSLLALHFAAKPPSSRKTYGYHRLEILAALVNGLALWLIAAYILFEAHTRFFNPPPVKSLPLLVIACLGLAVNLVGAAMLYPARDQGLNLRSAFLHLAADSLGSVAVIAAALAMLFKGWAWFDPLAAAMVAVLIILGSWQLVFEAADILMEATPRHLDLGEVEAALAAHPGVAEVHDLHIWTIATGLHTLSAHLEVPRRQDRDCLTWELEEMLRRRFGLEHTTLQLEGPEYHNPRVCSMHSGAARR